MKNHILKLIVIFLVGIFLHSVSFAQTSIAVIDFEGKGVTNVEASALTDRLRTELFNIGGYKVVERGMMEEILGELGYQQSGCTSDECIVEVGKHLGVEQMVGGSISKVGRTYSVSARIVSVETREIIKTATYDYRGEIDDLLTSGMRNVALKLTGQKSTETEITRQSELVTSEVDIADADWVDIGSRDFAITVALPGADEKSVVEEAEASEPGFKIGVGTGFTVYTGEYMSEATSAPSMDIFVRIPYTLYLGALKVSVGAELQTFSFTFQDAAEPLTVSGIGLMGVANFDIIETPDGAVYAHVGAGLLGSSLGITAGAKFDYPIPNVMEGKLSATAFLKANATLDGGIEVGEGSDGTSSTGWANFGIALNYEF